MSKLDELNMQVTAKIVEIEKANRDLSILEEAIANLTSPHSIEGKIARKGAVKAAMAGRSESRAIELCDRFLRESGDSDFRNELRALLSD